MSLSAVNGVTAFRNMITNQQPQINARMEEPGERLTCLIRCSQKCLQLHVYVIHVCMDTKEMKNAGWTVLWRVLTSQLEQAILNNCAKPVGVKSDSKDAHAGVTDMQIHMQIIQSSCCDLSFHPPHCEDSHPPPRLSYWYYSGRWEGQKWKVSVNVWPRVKWMQCVYHLANMWICLSAASAASQPAWLDLRDKSYWIAIEILCEDRQCYLQAVVLNWPFTARVLLDLRLDGFCASAWTQAANGPSAAQLIHVFLFENNYVFMSGYSSDRQSDEHTTTGKSGKKEEKYISFTWNTAHSLI